MSDEKTIQIDIGIQEPQSIRVPDDAECLLDQALRNTPLPWKQMVQRALDQPIDFPSFSLCLVPDDHIVIAVSADVTNVTIILVEVVQYLLHHSFQPSQIAVVLTGPIRWIQKELIEAFSELNCLEVDVVVFDPDNEEERAYLGADENAEPIYVCRRILEADFVLPITQAVLPETYGYCGPHGIAPWFYDAATQTRWRSAAMDDSEVARKKLTETAIHQAQLVGVQCVFCVIPGPKNSIAEVVFGMVEAVAAISPKKLLASWSMPKRLRYDAIVAGIDLPAERQTWASLAELASSACSRLNKDGILILCTYLGQRPMGALKLLSSVDDESGLEFLQRKCSDPFSLAAAIFLRLRQHYRIFVLSSLPQERIEQLGLGATNSVEEISRLVRNASQCLIVSSAQSRPLVVPNE